MGSQPRSPERLQTPTIRMRCPVQSSLIARAKNLMTIPFKHLPEWNDDDAHINAEVWLKPLNTLSVDNYAEDGWQGGSVPLPALWVLDYIFDGNRSYGLDEFGLTGEWNDHHCYGNATAEELEMMEKMLEDWHRDLTRWMCDWQEYEESVMEEDWGKTWYLEDFGVNNE